MHASRLRPLLSATTAAIGSFAIAYPLNQHVLQTAGVDASTSAGAVVMPADSAVKGRVKAFKLARYFDHTNLKPEATVQDIQRLCQEAIDYSFYSVCVNSSFVRTARMYLDTHGGHHIAVCAVVGFPLGAMDTASKAFEAQRANEDGADEIDMVIPVGRLKEAYAAAKRQNSKHPKIIASPASSYVLRDISNVASVTKRYGCILKVILETALLDDDEINYAVRLAGLAGADYVKTSTGFAKGGATVEDVRLMAERAATCGGMGVKASGGIRTLMDASLMISAGATRLGASSSVSIIKEAQRLEALEIEEAAYAEAQKQKLSNSATA